MRFISGHNSRLQEPSKPHYNKALNRWVLSRGNTKVYRYRVVAEEMLGRPLRPDEIVHHINGDSSDDRPENLEVMTRKEHAARHPDNPKPPNRWKLREGA